MFSACSLLPQYQRPAAEVPAAYKEASELNGWKVSEPQDQQIRESWWEAYQDQQLNQLVQQALSSNKEIAVSLANFNRAMALSGEPRSFQYPTVNANASATRAKRSQNALRVGASPILETYNLGFSASWEIDLWGRIRSQVEAGEASFQATVADLEVVKLSISTNLAQAYFQLRTLDSDYALLESEIKAFERAHTLTKNRYQAGVATKADVNQAEVQLKNTQVLLKDIRLQRAQVEHLIATLIGKTPADLNIPFSPFSDDSAQRIPNVPKVLPSQLLERRPDIAAAERRVAAANANVGITKAAFFPALSLSASAGYQSNQSTNLLNTLSRVWSIGPLVALNVFDGGLRKSQTNAAIASYDATVSTYQQTVLSAFQEVEDNLIALNVLSEESVLQQSAVKSANEALQQSLNRYKAGTIDYLDVAVLQTNALNSQRNAIAIHGRRLQASIGLIKAIGGGWDATKINQTSANNP